MGSNVKLSKVQSLFILFLAGVLILIAGFSASAQPKWGLGAKVIGKLPFVTGSVAWSNVELGLGAYYTTKDNVEMTFVSVDGKYLFFDRRKTIRPYIGVKGMSIQASSGIYSVMVSGGGATGGISWLPMPSLNIEAGAGYISFTDLDIGSVTLPINLSGSIFEVGLTWRF